MSGTPRFLALDLLRLVLAMYVAAAHLDGAWNPAQGHLAVDFFFILSGFVLCAGYLPRAAGDGFYSSFLVDRIARLYPLHLLTLLALVPLNILFWSSTGVGLEHGWAYQDGYIYTFFLNLILLQSLGFAEHLSWNAPSWSISVELFVNLFLGLAIIGLSSRRKWLVWAGAAILAGVGYFALFTEIGYLGAVMEPVKGPLNASVVRGFAGISLGVVCFGAYSALQQSTPGGIVRWIAVLIAIALAGLSLYWLNEGAGFAHADFALVPLFFVTILVVALAEHWTPIKHGASLLYALGGASYAVYLLHWPVITFLRYQAIYAWHWRIDFADPATTALILGGVLACAIAVFFLIELPLKRATKRWLSGRPANT